jgi:hypothetical protein
MRYKLNNFAHPNLLNIDWITVNQQLVKLDGDDAVSSDSILLPLQMKINRILQDRHCIGNTSENNSAE